jgi:CheY-like chemotaxis protein
MMPEQELRKPKPRILYLVHEPSIGKMVFEILALEGYPVNIVRTSSEAFSILNQHKGDTIVIMDNLHAFTEGQRFLATLKWETELWARTSVLSMAVSVVCDRLREKHGQAIDAHLAMPFTADQLMRAIDLLA